MKRSKNKRERPANHSHNKPKLTRKQLDDIDKEALALAELIYDMYQDDLASGKIKSGQNNAQQSTSS